jgi:hypothetical protein
MHAWTGTPGRVDREAPGRPFGRWFSRRLPRHRTCGFHRIRRSMNTSSGRPPVRLALVVNTRSRAERRYSPAISFRPVVPRAHWTLSPCGRLSRPPWWVVTPTTTTGPPPRPGGNSGRCACSESQPQVGGHRRGVSHVHHRPVGRVGAQLYPGGLRRALPQHSTRPHPPTGRPGRSLNRDQDRVPRQPTTASFRADAVSRGL